MSLAATLREQRIKFEEQNVLLKTVLEGKEKTRSILNGFLIAAMKLTTSLDTKRTATEAADYPVIRSESIPKMSVDDIIDYLRRVLIAAGTNLQSTQVELSALWEEIGGESATAAIEEFNSLRVRAGGPATSNAFRDNLSIKTQEARSVTPEPSLVASVINGVGSVTPSGSTDTAHRQEGRKDSTTKQKNSTTTTLDKLLTKATASASNKSSGSPVTTRR